MPSLSSIIDDIWSHPSLLILQSSVAQSSLSLFRKILQCSVSVEPTHHLLLFCFLYSPSSLIPDIQPRPPNIEVHDWTQIVPGYHQTHGNSVHENVFSIVRSVPTESSLHVAIDSLGALLSDAGSTPVTYNFLRDLFSILKNRFSVHRLTLHVVQDSPLLPLLIQPSFSLSLMYLIAHPTVILSHLAKEYLTLPPPLSTPEKFWKTFIPLSERLNDINQLVFGKNTEGIGLATEMIVELLVRKVGSGGKREIDRVLEGWKNDSGACHPLELESMNTISMKKLRQPEAVHEPVQHTSFNLNFTTLQKESRARVPLPYMHRGDRNTVPQAIFYEPDSADDLDEDDPDEDLDI